MSIVILSSHQQTPRLLLRIAASTIKSARLRISTPSFLRSISPLSTGAIPSASVMSTPSSAAKRQPALARPSSSIVLLSPTNEVLLLRRVQTSSSFASAYVFPGGNLDAKHDGEIPPPESLARHRDGPAYRLGAIRECFEETGILLAKKEGKLVDLTKGERDEARKKVHSGEILFGDFLREIGCEPDVASLIPFTRWLTPTNVPKRFTTQMYLYLLPISNTPSSLATSQFLVPTADGGIEHTTALFAPPSYFLTRGAAPVRNQDSSPTSEDSSSSSKRPSSSTSTSPIILFPPQAYLLTILSQFITPQTTSTSLEEGPLHYTTQRKRLLSFLRRVPTSQPSSSSSPSASSSAAAAAATPTTTKSQQQHPTALIPWSEKVICPALLFVRSADGRNVLGLDKPGLEITQQQQQQQQQQQGEGKERGGDWERVALVRFGKGGPSEVEIRKRAEVVDEERTLSKAKTEKL